MNERSWGTIRRFDGGIEARLERHFEHRRDEVWRMLTDPAKFALWLAPGSIELRVGGKVQIDFSDSGTVIDSRIEELDPQHVLVYSWSHAGEPSRPLRWELEDAPDGTRLVLTVRIPAGEKAEKAFAGFEGHLEMLAAALEDAPIKFPFDLFLEARAGYRRLLGV